MGLFGGKAYSRRDSLTRANEAHKKGKPKKAIAEYKKILEDARAEAYKLQREAYAAADEKSFPLFEKRKLEVIKITPEMRE